MEPTPIARAIFEKGLKKGWVAKKAKISPSTLSLILKGQSDPTLPVALKLAFIVSKSVEELWGHLIETWLEEVKK